MSSYVNAKCRMSCHFYWLQYFCRLKGPVLAGWAPARRPLLPCSPRELLVGDQLAACFASSFTQFHTTQMPILQNHHTQKNINQLKKITSSTLAPSCRPDMKPSAWSSEGKLLKNQWKSTWTKHNKTIITILYRVCYVLNVGEVHAVVVTLPS